jgi:hypothetical protein
MEVKLFYRLFWYLFLSILFLFQISFSQSPDTIWTKTFGGEENDFGRQAIATTENGFLVAGYTRSFGSGSNDIWLILTNANGDTISTSLIGGIGDERVYSIQKTTDEGYILSGRTDTYGNGGDDIWLIKLDQFADTVWTKTYGGDQDEWGQCVQQTQDDGYIIAGFTNSFGSGESDVFLVKTNSNGDTAWTKTIGWLGLDWANFVSQTADEGYIITGYTESKGAGSEDLLIIKTDDNGDTVWTKTYGGIGTDIGNCIRITSDQDYLITGLTGSSSEYLDSDIWLIKTDSNGEISWEKRFGGSQNEEGWLLHEINDNGILISGYTSSYGKGGRDGWLIRTDLNGDTIWTKTFGGSSDEFTGGVNLISDGGFILTGYTFSSGAGGSDIYLIRLEAESSSSIKEKNNQTINEFHLYQNYPNPFNPSTKITYSIAKSDFISLKIYSTLGQEIQTLVNEFQGAGNYSVNFDAQNLSSGIYFYKLKVGSDYIQTKKMVLMR